MSEEPLKSIVLVDEDDNEIEFDVMDKFPYKESNYCVLFPVDYDSDDAEFVILEEKYIDGEAAFVGIEEAKVLDAVFNEYKRRHKIE